MAYFVLSRNGEESFDKSLSLDRDIDHPRVGPGDGYNISCKESSQSK